MGSDPRIRTSLSVHDRASSTRKSLPPGWNTVAVTTGTVVPCGEVTAPVSVLMVVPALSVISL
jgi:hypothetical protein